MHSAIKAQNMLRHGSMMTRTTTPKPIRLKSQLNTHGWLRKRQPSHSIGLEILKFEHGMLSPLPPALGLQQVSGDPAAPKVLIVKC